MNMFMIMKAIGVALVTFGVALVVLNLIGAGLFWSPAGCLIAGLPALVLGGIVWKGREKD